MLVHGPPCFPSWRPLPPLLRWFQILLKLSLDSYIPIANPDKPNSNPRINTSTIKWTPNFQFHSLESSISFILKESLHQLVRQESPKTHDKMDSSAIKEGHLFGPAIFHKIHQPHFLSFSHRMKTLSTGRSREHPYLIEIIDWILTNTYK